MSDLLNIASSGIRAYARALDAVADNVANAATPGHVRRTVNLTALGAPANPGPLELEPGGGNGVRIASVRRASDELMSDSVRRIEGDVAALGATDRWLSAVQSSLTGAAGLDQPIASLFASLSDLAAEPDSLAVRATVLANADALAQRFNDQAAGLDRLATDIAAEADRAAATLSSLATGLADVNARLRRAASGSGASARLQDDRDRLLGQMATIATIDVRFDMRGMATVRVPDGGGPVLVDGTRAADVRVRSGPVGLELRIGQDGAGAQATLLGGELHGLSTATALLAESRGRVDALATRLANDMNAAHRSGVDLDGLPGGALFRTDAPVVEAAAANGGTARIRADLAPGAPAPALVLIFDGSANQWTLSRADLSASVSGALPLTLDSVAVDGIGAARNGDLFRISPGTGAAAIRLNPLAPEQLAAAPPFIATPGAANTGRGVAAIRPAPSLVPPATPPFTVETVAGPLLELRDGSGTLLAGGAPGDWLVGDGFDIRITGDPAEGDRFSIVSTPAGSSANGNALALLALRDATTASGTIAGQLDRIAGGVAVPLQAVRTREDIARANRDTAAIALQERAGVDLNTEAADMLRLQQAYQANARIIQTARETFDAILASAR